MWDSFLNSVQGFGNSVGNGMASLWDKANAPTDDVLAALADEEEYRAKNGITDATAEHDKAWSDVQNSNLGSKVGGVLKAMGGMSPRTGQQQMSGGGGGVRTGGGTNIQTEDQYAMAMKALVDKYGQFMFNKDF